MAEKRGKKPRRTEINCSNKVKWRNTGRILGDPPIGYDDNVGDIRPFDISSKSPVIGVFILFCIVLCDKNPARGWLRCGSYENGKLIYTGFGYKLYFFVRFSVLSIFTSSWKKKEKFYSNIRSIHFLFC